MCGIVAVINKNGSEANLDLLSRMAAKIHHRGPDDEGHLIDSNVGLFHKRLAIIDLVSGKQPMTSGTATILFNGAVYNYVELRNTLIKRGCTFLTQSDTEVILQAYLEFGMDFIYKLNGMYALLIYDFARRQIIAARDHFGIKPLYYYSDDEHLLFASEIKALLEHPAVSAEPDYESIQEYLAFQFVLGDKTMFKGIRKLEPGQYLVISLKDYSERITKYWEPDFVVDTDHTEKYFINELRRLLEDSVDIQMRCDVPLGTTLSGGLDSSIVTTLASKKYNGRLKTFTGAFKEGPEFDEREYAFEVAKHCKAEMFRVCPTEAQFIDSLPKLVYFMDEPAAGPGLFPQYVVSKTASEEVKVTLGGQGGDEIFGGYARYMVAYLEQAIKGAIYETNVEDEHIVSLQSILPNLPALKQYVPMLQRFWQSELFEPMDLRYFRLINRCDGDWSTISADFQKSYVLHDVFAKFQMIFNDPDTKSYYNKMVHFDLMASLPALLQVEDRVSMAVSLESRVPLLDHRLVQLVLNMSPQTKFKGAEMKYVLKKAVHDLLPPKIMKRKDKMGFPVPLHLWARNNLREFFQDILLSKACKERGLFNPYGVKRLIENEAAFGRHLWGLVNIELWFRQFIDKSDG